MPKPTTIRIKESSRRSIETIVERTNRDFSSIVNELLEEALRMRQIPGIVFADGPTGRRARLAGTGLDVFEVIGTFHEIDGDFARLAQCYPWLGEIPLRAALAYAQAYPQEIEARLERERLWDAEETRRQFPFTVPPCASI